MRLDSEIKTDVENELDYDPLLDNKDIAVQVKAGVVMLSGYTRTYADRFAAEKAAKRVLGVVGVANDIEVRLPTIDARPDPDIARDAVAAIRNRLPVSANQIQVTVKDGAVTLEVPQNLAADVDLHTGDGHIDLDLPVTTEGKIRENEIRGKLNGGGNLLMIHTGDGSIRLRKG